MPETTDRIFISYSRKDESFARRLTIWLHETLDVGVWIDVDDIPVGIKWSAAIQDGLDNCEVMVVIISPESMQSVNVEDEWQYFIDQGKPVVPILLRTAPVPYQLRRIQYIDFSVRDEYNESLRRLVIELRQHLILMPDEELNVLRAEGRRVEIDGIKPTTSKSEKRARAKVRKSEDMLERSGRALLISNIINAVLAILIVIVIGVIAAFFFFLRTTPEGIAIRVEGNNIVITRDGQSQPLENYENGEVPIGSEIVTGAEPARVQNPNGSQVVVGPGSSARVNGADASSTDLSVETGSISVAPQGIEAIIRTADNVSASSNTGTLDIQVDDIGDTVQVNCPDGGCSVSDAEGANTIELEANNSVTVTNGDVANAVVSNIPGDIAFTSYQHGPPEIYLMDTSGENLIRLTNNQTQDFDPAWSPSGTRIVYQTFDLTTRTWMIASINPSGGDPTILTEGIAGNHTEPAYSPDGQRIAFVSDRDGNDDIYIMNRDGTTVERITTDDAPDTSPTWSPDGTQIAFVSVRDGNNTEIYVLTLGSDEAINLTNNPANDDNPAWSPDGTKIAFDSQRDDFQGDVYYMNADGTEVVNVSNSGSRDEEPSWSPDSQQIVFVSQRSGNNKIFIVPIDLSSEPANLSGSISYEQSEPSWLPTFRAGA